LSLGAVAALAITSATAARVDSDSPGSASTVSVMHNDKVTICHAAGHAGTTTFVTLTISVNAVYGPGGHFNNNGTPQAGHELDYFGPCVTEPDVCPNIEGNQHEIPDGMVKDEQGNCVTPPPDDVCPNIEGNQHEIPDGMVKDEHGNCVPEHGPKDLTIEKTAAGHYDVQYTWTIDKQVKLAGASDATYSDNAVLSLPDGGAGSVTWKVAVVRSSFETNLAVTGTITVSNPNGTDVTGVSVSDPGGVVDCSPADGVQSSGLTVPANGSITCTYTATPGGMVPTNTATVSWGNHQSASATADITWSKGADLGIPATVDDGGVIVGAELQDSSTKTYDERWTCSHGKASPNAGRTNTATVTWDDGSDSDSASVQVGCGDTPPPPPPPPSDEHMDVQVTKVATAQVQLVDGHAEIAYTVRVRNNGPNGAHNVVLKDAAPTGVTFVAITQQPVAGSCTISAALLECSLDSLGPGVERQIGFSARVTQPGTYTNCATGVGDGQDTNGANNTACASTLVTAPVTPPTPPTPPTPKPEPKPKPKPKPELCRVLRVTPGMVKANGKHQVVVAKVTKSRTPVAGVAVRFSGNGLGKVARTNKQGVARVGYTPRKAGIVLVRITSVKACNSARIGVVGVFEPPVTGLRIPRAGTRSGSRASRPGTPMPRGWGRRGRKAPSARLRPLAGPRPRWGRKPLDRGAAPRRKGDTVRGSKEQSGLRQLRPLAAVKRVG
jgi:uncharacterized repeat protein (TIGR01451 family)